MLFDKLFTFLVYYFAFLLLIALIGMKFAKKHQELSAPHSNKKSAFKGLYKHCPCRRAVENGTMSVICIYSGVGGFMLSLSNIALMSNHNTANFIVLTLSTICAYMGWVLKKD